MTLIYRMSKELIHQKYFQTREDSVSICVPLAIEDYVVQPIPEVSPPKWHLGHTTWFFEQFILVKYLHNYRVFDEDFSFLFNSYYNNMGTRIARPNRGNLTRPTVDHIYQYRNYVDKAMLQVFQQFPDKDVLDLITIGVHHEQQHQELLAYDIKYILGIQPTFPVYGASFLMEEEQHPLEWINIEAGLYGIGAASEGFAYDNERPRHKQYVDAFTISNRLVTNGEYLDFIQDGGYQNFNLWHDEGWKFIQENEQHPLYWEFKDDAWHEYTFEGLQKMNQRQPVTHLSFYEAHAYAEWKGMRLPTEFEWEIASERFKWGLLWEWTNSSYLPYTGFIKAKGALGEYNGKFMLNQMVLRGASIATPTGHSRPTYRNFFHANSKWIFSGLRLVK